MPLGLSLSLKSNDLSAVGYQINNLDVKYFSANVASTSSSYF